MIVSVYMLNMGGESMQPCRTSRLTGNQSVKPLSNNNNNNNNDDEDDSDDNDDDNNEDGWFWQQ